MPGKRIRTRALAAAASLAMVAGLFALAPLTGVASSHREAPVLALGFVVLTLTEVFAPERVYPWLGLASGLIAFGLGASLLVARHGSWSGDRSDPEHHHPHDDGSTARGHAHPHPVPSRPLSRKSLTALAVAGGMLPSPTALVVLLAAVALDRIAYGLALIGAFSIGLAAALVVVGLIALRARDVVAGRMSGRTARLVPVLSAASIALLGLVLTFRGSVKI